MNLVALLPFKNSIVSQPKHLKSNLVQLVQSEFNLRQQNLSHKLHCTNHTEAHYRGIFSPLPTSTPIISKIPLCVINSKAMRANIPIMAALEFQTSAFSVKPQNETGSSGSSTGASTPAGSLAARTTSERGLEDVLLMDWGLLLLTKILAVPFLCCKGEPRAMPPY
jgi:hypothetical protein